MPATAGSNATQSKPARSRKWLRPRLDWLLIFVPIAIALRFVPAFENPTALFIVSCLGIIPLAGWMGRATEHLAEYLGQGVGGLLNATFGNAAELIIAIVALNGNHIALVQSLDRSLDAFFDLLPGADDEDLETFAD